MTIFQQTKIALGCENTLSIVTHGQIEPAALYNRLWLEIFQFEQRFSRFLPASELSAFNRQAGLKQIVSPEFQAILADAKAIGEETEGLFNPFVLPALQRAGYTKSFVRAHENDASDNFEHRSLASIQALEIGDEWARIPYGTAIDLGGCGKGYMADRLAALVVAEPEVAGYWFSLGGDVIAGGCDQNGDLWQIGIEDVSSRSAAARLAGIVQVSESTPTAVATSATTDRRGKHKGKAWHHIIDPSTGRPAQTDLLAVSIRAASAFRADVLASCLIVAGSRAAKDFMSRYEIDGVLLQTTDKARTAYGSIKAAGAEADPALIKLQGAYARQ